MKIDDIAKILDGEILTQNTDLQREVYAACGSDMMSDVLAYVKNQAVLLTGLNNLMVIRTAQMMDMLCVVFVRGKKPNQTIIDMADENEITVITTDKTMFAACGLLYGHGLREASDEQ
ncbi:MAG: DRTGG domain-containing protein [Oscillospiraceae bacterium]|nr:DRTGG domain-containing protein [Oscillospiraceae bacterium]